MLKRLHPGHNLNLAPSCCFHSTWKWGTEAFYRGVWEAFRVPLLKSEQGVRVNERERERDSAACELGSFVLTEWLYASIQFKGLAKAQLLSSAVWIKGCDMGLGLENWSKCASRLSWITLKRSLNPLSPQSIIFFWLVDNKTSKIKPWHRQTRAL